MPGQKRKRKGGVKLQDFHQRYPARAISRRPWRKGPSFAAKEVLYWKHVREQLETLQKLQRRKVAEQCHLQGLRRGRGLWRKTACRTPWKTWEQQMTS